jgi:hypothetical protein
VVDTITTPFYRDPAAWYHIVVAVDTSQPTYTNGVKMYVNGVQVTSFGTSSYTQNTNTYVNTAGAQQALGIYAYSTPGGYFDGEMAEVNFIDGQQLGPNAFGAQNQYGQWQPIAYRGSFGTNGFYLPFNTGSSTYAGSYSGSNYIYAPDSDTWAFSGNFTMEAFFYVTSTSASLQNIIGQWVDSGGSNRATQFGVNSSAQLSLSVGTSVTTYTVTGGTIKPYTWYHGALVVNGTTLTGYLNGVSIGSTTISGTINNSTAGMGIGAYANGSWPLTGGISNARITNTAVYTSNFTPPTTNLTAITGTQLLTLQNATIVDNSTNAFTFTNVSSLTTGQTYPFAIGIFADQGSSNNNWTPNSITGVPGSTLDYMTDVPTLTSATAANYAVLNPLYPGSSTITNGNLSSASGTTTVYSAAASMSVSSGKWYWEVNVTAIQTGNQYPFIGAYRPVPASLTGSARAGGDVNGFSYRQNGYAYVDTSTFTSSWAAMANGDVIGIALDLTTLQVSFYKNNTLQGTITGLVAGTYTPCDSEYNGSNVAYNFGQQPFAYTPPTGFKALNTYNLP